MKTTEHNQPSPRLPKLMATTTANTSYKIHASRDPAMIRRAVEIKLGPFSQGIDDLAYEQRRINEETAEADWAAFPAASGYPALTVKARAHHLIATGDWGFLEQQYKQPF